MKKNFLLTVFLLLFFSSPAITQDVAVPGVTPTPPAATNPDDPAVPRERRAAAYAKLLEGQRYVWTARRTNSALARRTATRLARTALRKAVELNPRLAEGYTALAELSLRGSDADIDEAISLSTIAVKIDPDNFGAHKYLGRLYTVKSGLGRGKIDPDIANNAIGAWKEVGRLDPQNAEAWAFLSEFYREKRDTGLRIESLRNWLAAANTPDSGFYVNIIRGSEGLAPELAAVELGEALIDVGKKDEALLILASAVSEDPENLRAVDLLGRALESVEGTSLSPAIEALRQAVYSNPENISLVEILAESLARSGETDAAAKVIRESVKRVDARKSAALLMTLGDIYADNERTAEALDSYRMASSARGIKNEKIVSDSDRGFALLLIGKMVKTLQKSGRVSDAENVIENSKGLFSVDDFVMDREKISLMRSTGRRVEALNLLRTLRQKDPEDYNLIRKEAELLTDLGRVDEAAALIVPLIENKTGDETRSIKYDDFVNRLFIAGLYIQADRGEDAIYHAEKAFAVANGDQSKQLATLRIASGQLIAGDYKAAEQNLKDILEATPDNPMALNNLGFLYLRRDKNYAEALDLIEKAVRIDPRNPEYLDSLGLAHLKLGNLDKAEIYLRRAIRYDADPVTAYERLGDVLLKKGNEGEAQSLWKKALSAATKATDVERIEKKIGM